ncbi:MAG: hypothetical protein KAW12_08195 [Candidatus Aminicenantes bacterium]|nr:hypothetical protein [Candidatus Aminicenantes bacterium]
MTEYTYKPLQFDDQTLKLYSEFLSRHYKRPDLFTFEYVKWQYAENPVGKAVGCDVFFDGELVSHGAAVPQRAFILGEEETWLLQVNFMTVKEHRRKGLSAEVANRMEGLGYDLGHTFAIGIANRNSTPYSVKARGMELSATLDARIGTGPTRKKKNGFADYDFRVLWDKESLAWRLKRPGPLYWKKEKRGNCAVFTPSGKPGFKTLLGNFAAQEVGEAVSGRGKFGLPLTLWIGIDPQIDWGKSLYFNLPGWLRQSPLNVVFKDLSGRKRSLTGKKILFQSLDFDAF